MTDSHRPGRRTFGLAALAAMASPLAAWAQRSGADSPHLAVYMYQGATAGSACSRRPRKQREVVIYYLAQPEGLGAASPRRSRRRPGSRRSCWRASSEKVLQRAVHEARCGPLLADILETNGPEMEALLPRKGCWRSSSAPHFRDLPAAGFPRHRHYVADRFNFFTDRLQHQPREADEVPNSYEDLVHPRWAGRVGIEGSDVDWFGAIVKSWGRRRASAFFRKLGRFQAADPHRATRSMAELVASGEIPLAATLYNHNVERLIVKGAPVKWKAIKPTFGRPNAIGVGESALRIPTPPCCSWTSCCRRKGRRSSRSRNRVPGEPVRGHPPQQSSPSR
jgi:iron(III) transport system substrate-binding protein